MQGRLAFCARLGVLTLALAACSTDTSTEPTDPDPGQPPIAATHKWSDPATWPGGQVPVAGAAVVIPPELNVLLDLSPPPLTSLTVEGALVFDQRDLALTSGWIVVSGTLRVGTSGTPFAHQATITLTGSPDSANVSGMGNKILGLLPGGTLDLHGESRAGWTRLAATAFLGGTQLSLQQPMTWRAGDKLVVVDRFRS